MMKLKKDRLPDKMGKHYRLPRDFLLTIINTVELGYLNQMKKDQTTKRMCEVDAKRPAQHIELDAKLAEALFAHDHLSYKSC